MKRDYDLDPSYSNLERLYFYSRRMQDNSDEKTQTKEEFFEDFKKAKSLMSDIEYFVSSRVKGFTAIDEISIKNDESIEIEYSYDPGGCSCCYRSDDTDSMVFSLEEIYNYCKNYD